MSKAAWDRIQPFLFRKESRQRIILYLVASGYSVGELTRMPAGQLRKLDVHGDIRVAIDEATYGQRASEPAFVYPTGKPIPHTAYYRLLRYAAERVVGRPMSQEMFRDYVQGKAIK